MTQKLIWSLENSNALIDLWLLLVYKKNFLHNDLEEITFLEGNTREKISFTEKS